MPSHATTSRSRRAATWPRLGCVLVCAITALLPLGCQQDEDIRHYQAPRTETPMVGLRVAIIKNGNRTWFFKLTGPKDVVEDHAKDFGQFLQSIQFTKDEKEPVIWKVPEGWEKEAAGGQTHAAYRVGPKENAGQLTVVPLGGEAGSLLANVNRWRNQLGLKPVAEGDLEGVTKETINGQEVTVVQITASGRFRKTGAPAMPIGRAPVEPGLKYDTPEGWTKLPQPPQFAVAGFRIVEGESKAQVSVSAMAPQPLLENVRRWRGQVGLGPVDAAALTELVQPFAVGASEAKFLDMGGPRDRILVILLPQGDSTWIFKMMGPTELVGRQKAAFEKFVRSVRFNGGSDE